MKKQGLIITIDELMVLSMKLSEESKETNEKLGKKNHVDWFQEFQINIINQEESSDTWRIEK